MWAVYKKQRWGTNDVIATTENEFQSKKITNVLNKMAIGEYFYQEVSE
ncbi:hypothetical protein OIT44_04185 [Weissella ceti]|uniref:Uncharacterized protein n=1 Tax=Weissella ceti TaxID=759620 RepID=A0ABT3E4W2_9LACO|nr:hypothetical protein [Weissella ceti]MCW0953274.1 hypothetical protein [Weissella ceti]